MNLEAPLFNKATHAYWLAVYSSATEGESSTIILTLMSFLKNNVKSGPPIMWSKLIIIFITVTWGLEQLLFLIGRYYKKQIVQFLVNINKVHYLDNLMNQVQKNSNYYLKFFRIQYGIRLILPLILGMIEEISTLKFTVFNFISASIWALILSAMGLALAKYIVPIFDIQKIHYWVPKIFYLLFFLSLYNIFKIIMVIRVNNREKTPQNFQ